MNDILGRAVDERFLMHRLRSSSVGGIAGGVLAGVLFLYRYYVDHVWNLDLLAVLATIVVVKMAVLLWHRRTN